MARDPDRAFFGHPRGLSTLFFTEMWERLSYYGARTLLLLYMIAEVSDGGRGMDKSSAGLVMALYMSSVYLLSLPGGWIADRFLGQRRAVTYGGLGIMVGNAMLAMPVDALFYPGLCVIALGTGLLKPNVSTIVGQLYAPDDVRRDAGYTIYYIGINIGAGIAPIICSFLAQSDTFKGWLSGAGIDPGMSWKFGFAAPAIGMLFGIVQYLGFYKWMGDAGLHPTIPDDPKKASADRTRLGIILGGMVGLSVLAYIGSTQGLTKEAITDIFGIGLAIGAVVLFASLLKGARDADERKRITAMIPLFLGSIGFFGVFEQASTTLSDFAEHYVHREWLGFNIESGNYQSVNAIWIVLLAPVFAWLWVRLARAKKEPSSVSKFGIGMVLTAMSFVVLIPTVDAITELGGFLGTIGKVPFAMDPLETYTEPTRVSATYLIAVYFFATLAELCISPVGLSSMNKLAPKRMAGMVMGTWFLGTSIGNYLAGRAAGFSEARGYGFLFYFLIIASLVIAAALFLVAPMIKRMQARGGDVPGADARTAETEPEPMPTAKVVSKKDKD